tara:strand:- start:512 stop:1051 length:540 start_codon:yes stop_codon:yes gene_type:complete
MKNTQTKIEKAFFEVEGIKNVFEGIHLGVQYSYGYEAYFTKETCLEIIKHQYNPFWANPRFDESKQTFIETWEEDGKYYSNDSEKVEVFGTTYYLMGNGWAWDISNEQRMNLYTMNPKRLEEKLSWLSSFYDIWEKSRAIDDSAINNLTQIYMDYCEEWDLPQLACDELICEILSILND